MKSATILVALLGLIAAANAVPLPEDRGFFDNILGDKFKQAKAILSEISASIKAGGSPVQIAKDLIAKHPEVLQNVNIVQQACQVSFLQNIDYVAKGCKFVNEHGKTITELVAKYKDDAKAWIDFISKYNP